MESSSDNLLGSGFERGAAEANGARLRHMAGPVTGEEQRHGRRFPHRCEGAVVLAGTPSGGYPFRRATVGTKPA